MNERRESGRESIDRLRDADGGLSAEAVRALLPYGTAFLFVDRVLLLDDRTVAAVYTVPRDSPWVEAHFPGFPLMPGALVVEGTGQAGSLIVRYRLAAPETKDVIALELERARFLAPVAPGETLTYRVELVTMGSRAARLDGEVSVDGRRAATARFVVGILDRGKVRRRVQPG
jgi:3-hydroxymyristoyl/3-hydroxydecanoyl-(acyl carrier protein) dehydratase